MVVAAEQGRSMVVDAYPVNYSPNERPSKGGMLRAFLSASLKDCKAFCSEIQRYLQKSFDGEFLASGASRRDLWRVLLPLPGIFAFVADRGDHELMIMNVWSLAVRHDTICRLLSLSTEERERALAKVSGSGIFAWYLTNRPGYHGGGWPCILDEDRQASTLDAAKVAADLGLRVLMLNFAHGYNCGGGFEHAAGSQEEAIFRSSSLFLSLWPHRRKDDGPGVLKRGTWIGDFDPLLPRKEPFYEHTECGGIYSPHVQLLGTDAEVAVATVAAQDVTRNPPFRPELLREKIRTVLWMAREHGHDAVILGAFGCGYFSNPTEAVAQIFQQVLATEFSGVFRLVVFALLRDRNFPVFAKCFPLVDVKRLPALLESQTPAPKPES
ncbi:unnamed protein product [Symbiodinium pilosum]|uniref:Microbial-type PARG catalytic domain-containing protein n=1 Tax=Symbiodinium pilosum TaxID=2952 RepID=A0A812VVN6_SYMPI|nr:unnamed protein product [Symbiodinium pilosum]